MQKELKIGLAIGAVLLVVLIVYLAVPKGDNDLAQNLPTETVTPEEETPSEGHPSDAPGTTVGKPAEGETQVRNPGPFTDEPTGPDAPASADENAWAVLLTEGPKSTEITSTPGTSLRAKNITGGVDAPATGAGTATPPERPTTPSGPESSDVQPPAAPESIDTPARPEGGSGTTTTSPPADNSARTHTIKRGETLSGIAQSVYGDQRYYITLQKANPTLDPARMRPGTVINLPDIESIKSSSSTSSSAEQGSSSTAEKTIDSDTEYRVQQNDSLYKISMKKYGSPSMVDALYELNKETIGNDSSRLKLGMVLKLPPKTTSDSPTR